MTKKPKTTRPSTQQLADFTIKRFERGASIKQIAAELGRSERTIRRFLILAGVKFEVGRKAKVLDSQLEGLYEKVRLKHTSYDILAAEFGVSKNTIRLRIKKYEREKRLAGVQQPGSAEPTDGQGDST